MKEFQIKTTTFSSIQLLNENEELVGELLFNLVAGFKEKIKIKEEIFKIKNTGFLWNDIKVFDENEKLMIESDISKGRFIYFGDSKEIYTYKYRCWFSNKANLFRNEELVISINMKGFFKTKYEIKVANYLTNYLMVLTFLNSYIRNSSSA